MEDVCVCVCVLVGGGGGAEAVGCGGIEGEFSDCWPWGQYQFFIRSNMIMIFSNTGNFFDVNIDMGHYSSLFGMCISLLVLGSHVRSVKRCQSK